MPHTHTHTYTRIYAGGEIASTFDHPELVKLGECDLIEEVGRSLRHIHTYHTLSWIVCSAPPPRAHTPPLSPFYGYAYPNNS